jgi:hypothetical protein
VTIGCVEVLKYHKPNAQHRIKLIAGFSLFKKVLADFKLVFYLLTLVLKTRNKPYTNTLAIIKNTNEHQSKYYTKT